METVYSSLNEETQGVMEISRLFFTDRSMKSCYLEIDGKVDPESQIGWVTSITFNFRYGESLIGKLKVPDMPMILDDEGNFTVDWFDAKVSEMTIKNMRAFQCFFQDVMPKKDDNQIGLQGPIMADMSVSKDGHSLAMSIDLSHPPRMKAAVTRLTIDGSAINITIKITNESPLVIFFGPCTFNLKQNQRTIGELTGELDITQGEYEVEFDGDIQDWVSGVATLKGDEYSSDDDFQVSWKQYAIRLFEVEVNLDKLDVSETDDGDVVDDDDDE